MEKTLGEALAASIERMKAVNDAAEKEAAERAASLEAGRQPEAVSLEKSAEYPS